MELSRDLSLESCSISIDAGDKKDVLIQLAKLISRSPNAGDVSVEEIRKGLDEREEMGSTGFGKGIAIPHCKVEGMKGFVLALGISSKGVAFDSMDGRSVHILCAIVGPPDDPDMHLRLLAVASRVLGSGKSRYELLRSATPFALREAFLFHAAPASALDSRTERKFDKLLLVSIQQEDTYNDVMELFLEMGLPGAVTHEGSLMGQVLSGAPVFAGFLDVFGRSKPEPKTILILVPGESLDELISSIEEITGDLDNHRGACIIVLSPDLIRGSLETL